jgi:hypothetical protein
MPITRWHLQYIATISADFGMTRANVLHCPFHFIIANVLFALFKATVAQYFFALDFFIDLIHMDPDFETKTISIFLYLQR